MNNNFLPPPAWFDTAIEIVEFARKQRRAEDFIADARLRPQIIGQSYSYRIDVLEQLVRSQIVNILDDRLTVGSSFDAEWFDVALKSGNSKAWELASVLGNKRAIEKKFNSEALKKIGDIGEAFIFKELQRHHPVELHSQIDHVSTYDDTLGYDISSPSIANTDNTLLMEVKTSVRPISGKFDFFLSRNEFNVGLSNRQWCIIAVSIVNSTPIVIGHLYCYQIESRLPHDIDESAKWASCKLSIEVDAFRAGLP
ncbi:hypothetical protein JCM19241_2708 [Vibrio ishigakensis]|uniref:Protein NO VEIN C-terminal domain-containing protein n=1 Tax=Vibrio ishigakensis TaxID=1481914 RepID=A0A0B8QDJ2_9VIBR|nr:hypothetical protein JCM19241_2708 [Vibrio ishigakensis]